MSMEGLKEIAERAQNGTLEFLEDESEFIAGCAQCGKCCHNRNDILLTPHDIYHMVQATKMPVQDMIKKYGDVYLGEHSRLPIISLKYREELDGTTTCRFLGQKDGKHYCRINDYKPNSCRIYPLGRMSSMEDKEKGDNLPKYFEQPKGLLCEGMYDAVKNQTKQVVVNWVGGKDKKRYADMYWVLFNKFTNSIIKTVNLDELYKITSQEFQDSVFNFMFIKMYCDYNFEVGEAFFLKKYEENTNEILKFLEIAAEHPSGKLKPKAA